MLSDAAKKAFWKSLGETQDEEPRDVFALLDGARVRQLPGCLAQQDAEFACLAAGESDPAVLTRSPYLVRVLIGSEISRWLIEQGWGQSWGIYALCPKGTDLDTLLYDLRDVMQARLPDGKIVAFRFYDPRVWRPFFPTCDRNQVRLLFGRCVSAFACEGENGNAFYIDSILEGRQSIPLPP